MDNYVITEQIFTTMVQALIEKMKREVSFPVRVCSIGNTGANKVVDKMIQLDANITKGRQFDLIIDCEYDQASVETICDAFPEKPIFVLIDNSSPINYYGGPNNFYGKNLIWPWTYHLKTTDYTQEDTSCIENLLYDVIGEDRREGLAETPLRVLKAWRYWTSGYAIDPADVLKVFEDGGENYDEMVMVKDIPIYSKCEHHLADIFGTCTIAYIPNGKIVGLSKLSRVADIFARRLQVQERLTAQIADCLNDNLNPLGVGVIIKARHMCMESRGICQQGHHTVTSALRGALKNDAACRAEFMQLANSK